MSSLARVSADEVTTLDYRLLSLPGRGSEQEQGRNVHCWRQDDSSPLMHSTTLCLVGRLVSITPHVSTYWHMGLSTAQARYRALAETVGERTDPLAELDRLSRLVSAAWKPGKSALSLLLEGRR